MKIADFLQNFNCIPRLKKQYCSRVCQQQNSDLLWIGFVRLLSSLILIITGKLLLACLQSCILIYSYLAFTYSYLPFTILLQDHSNFVNAVRYSPKGEYFVSGGADKKVGHLFCDTVSVFSYFSNLDCKTCRCAYSFVYII